MTITLPDRSPATIQTANTPATKTTASFTPAANSVLLMGDYIADQNATVRSHTPASTHSGAGSWTTIASNTAFTAIGYKAGMYLRVCQMGASPGTGTVSATPTGTHTSDGWNAMVLTEVNGADITSIATWVTALVSSATNIATLSMTLGSTPGANDAVLTVCEKWDMTAAGLTAPSGYTANSPNAGVFDSGWQNELREANKIGSSPAATLAWALSGTNEGGVAVAVLIPAAAGGVVTLTPQPFVYSQAVHRASRW